MPPTIKEKLAAAQESPVRRAEQTDKNIVDDTKPVLGAGPTDETSTAPKILSEVQQLKADKFKLQHQSFMQAKELASIKLQLMQQELVQSQTELEMEFRATLNAPLDAKFDWNTLRFVVIPEPKE